MRVQCVARVHTWPREIVSQGDKVKVRIVEVDADRRRLSLSLKGLDGEPLNDIAPNVLLAEEPIADDEVPAAEALEEPATVEEEIVVDDEPVAEAEAEAPAADEPEA